MSSRSSSQPSSSPSVSSSSLLASSSSGRSSELHSDSDTNSDFEQTSTVPIPQIKQENDQSRDSAEAEVMIHSSLSMRRPSSSTLSSAKVKKEKKIFEIEDQSSDIENEDEESASSGRSESNEDEREESESDSDEILQSSVTLHRHGLDEEVVEGEEPDEDEQRDGEEEEDEGYRRYGDVDDDDAPGKWYDKEKKTRKICRHFSYDLIDRAVRYQWEPEQLCELIHIISKELNFTFPQMKKLIEKTRIGTPQLLAHLSDKRIYQFTDLELCSILLTASSNMFEFIHLMDDALEMELLKLEEINHAPTLCSFTIENMNLEELRRYAVVLCEHSRSKTICGTVLELLTSRLEIQPAAELIVDVISLDFFYEIPGNLNSCINQLTRTKTLVIELLDESFERKSNGGDILDSDEDSHGNLRGFIAGSEGSESGEEAEDDGSEKMDDEDSEGLFPFSDNEIDGNSSGDDDDDDGLDEELIDSDEEEEEIDRKPKKRDLSKRIKGNQDEKAVQRKIEKNQKRKERRRLKRNLENPNQGGVEGKTSPSEQGSTSEQLQSPRKRQRTNSNQSNNSSKNDDDASDQRSGGSGGGGENARNERKPPPPLSPKKAARKKQKWLKFREKKKQEKLARTLATLESSNVLSYELIENQETKETRRNEGDGGGDYDDTWEEEGDRKED